MTNRQRDGIVWSAALLEAFVSTSDDAMVSHDAEGNITTWNQTAERLFGYPEVEILGENPSGKLSLRVARLSSGNRLEDRELHKRIDVRRYPTIDGVLTAMKPTGSDGRYTVSGDVAFRGVTRPCEDEMSETPVDDRTIRLEGQSTFDIRDFGMEPPRVLMLRVEPAVDVRVEIVAIKEED